MKKNKMISLLALTALCLGGCGKATLANSINITTNIHTELQAGFLSDSLDNFVKYASGTKEQSTPEPVKITINNKYYEEGRYLLEVAESTNPIATKSYNFSPIEGAGEVSIYNLKIGQTYEYTILDSKGTNSVLQIFTVDSLPPRNLKIDGVTNARDLGGYKTSDGKTVKQDMIIRSGAFNKDKAENITIKQSGIDYLSHDIGIRTEIDFRQEEVRTTSALGDSINYINIPMSGTLVYNDFTQLNNEIRDTFKILAKAENYPISIHCSIGTDRTGMISFLLNGLLGVSEDDLYRDYMFSNFGQIKGMRKLSEITDSYVKYLKALPGSTLQEQIRNYLLSIGMENSELDAIIDIMTE